MKNLLIPATLLLAASASAAPVITPQSIIVNPVQPDLNVRVWTDRDQTGQGTPDYRVGERIRLFTTVNQDAYVYLFNVNPDGSIDQILPNQFSSGANYIRANTVKQFPSANDNFTFDIAGPYGVNKVLALASKTPLNLNQISNFTSGQPFASVTVRGQENLAQALSIVVNPLPQNDWVTDVAYYNVATTYATRPAPVVVQPAPVYQQPAPVVTQPAPRPNPLITIEINIRPFANATNVRTYSEDNDETRVEFVSRSNLNSVYAYYNAELLKKGYVLREQKYKGDKVEAKYRRGRDEAKLEIKRKGQRYEVEIKLERD